MPGYDEGAVPHFGLPRHSFFSERPRRNLIWDLGHWKDAACGTRIAYIWLMFLDSLFFIKLHKLLVFQDVMEHTPKVLYLSPKRFRKKILKAGRALVTLFSILPIFSEFERRRESWVI